MAEVECRETQYTPPDLISLHDLYDPNTRIKLLHVQSKEVQASEQIRSVNRATRRYLYKDEKSF